MANKIKRRLILGSAVSSLVALPFLLRLFRKSTQLPESDIKISVPSKMSSSGTIDLADVNFEPLKLPHTDICENSITACLSLDNKMLLLAYSHGEDWNAVLCHVALEASGHLGSVKKSCTFGGTAVIDSLGCSDPVMGKQVDFSACVRFFASKPTNDDMLCKELLVRSSLKIKGEEWDYDPSKLPVTLFERKGQWSFRNFSRAVGFNSHCWTKMSNQWFYTNRHDIYRYRNDSVWSREIKPKIYNINTMSKRNETPDASNLKYQISGDMICSNMFDNSDGTIQFIKFPITEKAMLPRKEIIPDISPFDLGMGSLVRINADGNVFDEHPFPSLPIGSMALLTKTHWCFTDLVASQFFISAPLDRPKELTAYKMPKEQTRIDGVALNFRLLAVLPGGRHILCVRNVIPKYIIEAKKAGIPLCEVGIVNLPVSIG